MSGICNQDVFRIQDLTQHVWGGNQAWYAKVWQRRAGCGPTTCANLIWYLAKTRDDMQGLWPYEGSHKSNLLRLMEEVWFYVTPTLMGVNSPAIFAQGADRFSADKGVRLFSHILEVPANLKKRPGTNEVHAFLSDAFSDDLPVAFLNLDCGDLYNLESWHWVTLTAVADNHMTATMMDQGRIVKIDLALWLNTTRNGGGFVLLKGD